MGVGRTLGLQLRAWLEADPEGLRQSRALTNRLMDALGAEESLRGPVRDLASQPLLLQVLHSQGASRRSALASLSQQLHQTYAPAVLAELLDLLEAATGESITQNPSASPAAPVAVVEVADHVAVTATAPSGKRSLLTDLQPLAPGVALAACAALVISWAGAELDRALFEGWGWSGGVVLVLVLGLVQALSLGPWKGLRRLWPIDSRRTQDPHQAWRWVSAAWIHRNGIEAGVNLVLLLVILGASPLQLRDVLLRYCLTALACLSLAALMAQRFRVRRSWSGSSGPLSALIALAAGSSLLHGRVMVFESLGLTIPVWVLLLVYGALQLGWQLPRLDANETSTPLQRLLSSSWGWGLLLGLFWALVSWLLAQL